MKLNKLLIVGCLSIAAFSITSCKKSSSSSSKLVGTWDLKQLGEDMNGNGVMDANEVQSIDGYGTGTATFNSDGTGSEHIVFYGGLVDSSVTFKKWTLQNGDRDLVITASDGTTLLSHVTLTNTDLTVADTSTPITWTIWKKH